MQRGVQQRAGFGILRAHRSSESPADTQIKDRLRPQPTNLLTPHLITPTTEGCCHHANTDAPLARHRQERPS
jgi:hypothetical protein